MAPSSYLLPAGWWELCPRFFSGRGDGSPALVNKGSGWRVGILGVHSGSKAKNDPGSVLALGWALISLPTSRSPRSAPVTSLLKTVLLGDVGRWTFTHHLGEKIPAPWLAALCHCGRWVERLKTDFGYQGASSPWTFLQGWRAEEIPGEYLGWEEASQLEASSVGGGERDTVDGES